MAHIGVSQIGSLSFYPFCSNGFYDIAGKCVGCQFAVKSGVSVLRNATETLSGPISCNPNVIKYPLPLAECKACNQDLLNGCLTFLLLLSAITIFANGWSILVWLKQKKRTPQVVFKLSLAVSDFLFGALVLPSATASLISTFYYPHEEYYAFYTFTNRNKTIEEYEKNWEALFQSPSNRFPAFFLYLSQGTSLLSLLLLNIDRHIAITYSIKYNQIMTRRRSVALVLGVWLVISAVAFTISIATESFIIEPVALFLPVLNPDTDMDEMIKTITMYFLPLTLTFFASFFVAIATSIKLYRLSKVKTSTSFFQCSKPQRPKQSKTKSLCAAMFSEKIKKSSENNNSKNDKVETFITETSLCSSLPENGTSSESLQCADEKSLTKKEESERNEKRDNISCIPRVALKSCFEASGLDKTVISTRQLTVSR